MTAAIANQKNLRQFPFLHQRLRILFVTESNFNLHAIRVAIYFLLKYLCNLFDIYIFFNFILINFVKLNKLLSRFSSKQNAKPKLWRSKKSKTVL